MVVRPLTLVDVDSYLRLAVDIDAGSGLDGEAYSHPYSRSEPLDLDEARAREITRWSTSIDEPEWRRAWGLLDGADLVGHVYVAGGAIRSALHRVAVGIGVVQSHRRRGGGTLLLQAAIDWASSEPGIDWIDLDVFSDNRVARALYARHGFQVIGRTSDRFRVDGHPLDQISMTRNVATRC